MPSSTSPVLETVERWQAKDLLDSETARPLRREIEDEGRPSDGRWAQFALATTGALGVVLVLAVSAAILFVVSARFQSGGEEEPRIR